MAHRLGRPPDNSLCGEASKTLRTARLIFCEVVIVNAPASLIRS